MSCARGRVKRASRIGLPRCCSRVHRADDDDGLRLALELDLRDGVGEGRGFYASQEYSGGEEERHGGPTGFAVPLPFAGVANLSRVEIEAISVPYKITEALYPEARWKLAYMRARGDHVQLMAAVTRVNKLFLSSRLAHVLLLAC